MTDRRLHHLDGLRGVAAALVVIHHSLLAFDFALYSGQKENSRFAWDVQLSAWPFTSAVLGDLSVCVFFVLSGYVIACSLRRTTLGLPALLLKRYVRLGIPIFAVVMFAWALLKADVVANAQVARLTHSLWLGQQATHPPQLWSALQDGLYAALLFGRSHYDSSLWTMPLEFQGSLVLILIFSLCRRVFPAGVRRDTWCGTALLLFAAATHGSLLFLFGLGAAAFLIDLRSRSERLCRHFGVAAVLVGAGLCLGTVPFSTARPQWLTLLVSLAPIHHALPWRRMDPESFWHATGAVLLLMAVDGNAALRAWFARPAFQFLGRISFPLYLVHVPVLLSVGCVCYLRLLDASFPPLDATILSLLAFWAVTLVLATLLTWTVEAAAIRGATLLATHVQKWDLRVRARLLRVRTVSSAIRPSGESAAGEQRAA